MTSKNAVERAMVGWALQTVKYYRKLGFLSDFWADDEASLRSELAVSAIGDQLRRLDFSDDGPCVAADLAILALDRKRVWSGPLFGRSSDLPRAFATWIEQWGAISGGRFQPTGVRSERYSQVEMVLDGRAVTLRARRYDLDQSDPGIIGELNAALPAAGARFVAGALPDKQTGAVLMLSAKERARIEKERGFHFANDAELRRSITGLTGKPTREELVRAAFACDRERLEELLREGVSPNAVGSLPIANTKPRSALGCAVGRDDLESVQLLLKHGAPPSVADRDGKTPLHHAGSRCVADLLLEAGADVDRSDSGGMTPLLAQIVSAGFGGPDDATLDVIARLLEAGANPSKKDDDGRSALTEAKSKPLEAMLRNRPIAGTSQKAPSKSRDERVGSYERAALDEKRAVVLDPSYFVEFPSKRMYSDVLKRLARVTDGEFAPTRIKETREGTKIQVELDVAGRRHRLSLNAGEPDETPRFDWSFIAKLNALFRPNARRFALVDTRKDDWADDQRILVVFVDRADKKRLGASLGWRFYPHTFVGPRDVLVARS